MARRSKDIEELANVALQLSQASEDSLDLTSKLSSLLVSLLNTVHAEDPKEEFDLTLKRLHLSSHLSQDQHEDFKKAVRDIDGIVYYVVPG